MSTTLHRAPTPSQSRFVKFFTSFFTTLCDPSQSHVVELDMSRSVPKAAEASAIDQTGVTTVTATKPPGKTFAYQDRLPHLPIPPLEDTCKRYLKSLEALQDEDEHEATKAAVKQFLEGDGPRIQQKLQDWAKDKDRCVCEARS